MQVLQSVLDCQLTRSGLAWPRPSVVWSMYAYDVPTTFFSHLFSSPAMSAATDKARFYLEQSVPELKEYERKKLFSKVCAGWGVAAKILRLMLTRMKSRRSSRNDRTLSTSSMRVAPNRWTLCDMFSTR